MKSFIKTIISGSLICNTIFFIPAAAASWVSPSISVPTPTGTDVYLFSLGMANNGDAELIFSTEGNTNTIQSSHLPYLGNWSIPVPISTTPNTWFNRPTIAVDPRGNAVAIWELDVKLQSAFFINGTWSDPIDIPSTGRTHFAKAGVDASGNAIVVWWEGGYNVIQASTSAFKSGKWTAPQTLSPQGASPLVELAVNTSGDAISIWWGRGGFIEAASYINGIWSVPLRIGHLKTHSYIPSPYVDIDNNANGVAIWEGVSDNDFKIVYASSFVNGVWSTPIAVSPENSLDNELSPQVAVDKKTGDAVLVWAQDGQILGATLPFGGTWRPPVEISSGISNHLPAVGIDESGDALVVWNDHANHLVKASRMEPFGSSWSPEVIISTMTPPSPGDPESPKIAVNPCGVAVAPWIRKNKLSTLESATWTSKCKSKF